MKKILRKIFCKYSCPFCLHPTNQFDPLGIDNEAIKKYKIIGAGKRDAKCIKCNSTNRERLIYIYLKNFTKVLRTPDSFKVLHFAPEKNLFDVLIKTYLKEYISGDLFTVGYSYPNYIKEINVLDIPFKDNYFDLIICNHVLEHIENDSAAMKELHRVLRPSGKAILQVPISKIIKNTYEDFSIINPKQREIHFGQFDHVRIYGLDYIDKLNKSGFNVKVSNISSNYKRFGLNKNEDLFICSK